MQLGLAHRALEAEQKAVVELCRIVDAVFIEDEGCGQGAQLDEALRLRGMEGMQGRPRLPCRSRTALLLGATCAAARGPKGGHKISAEVLAYVAELKAASPELTTPECLDAIEEHFGVKARPPRDRAAAPATKRRRNDFALGSCAVFELQPYSPHRIAEQKVGIQDCQPIGSRVFLAGILVHQKFQLLPGGGTRNRTCIGAVCYLTRRPWKNPLLVVFCLMFAVSPCSATFCGSRCSVAAFFWGTVSSFGPLLLRLAAGMGGI
jgi:hypothetical protein